VRLATHVVLLAAITGWGWLILEVFTQSSFPEPEAPPTGFFRETVVPIAGHVVMFGVLAGLMFAWSVAALLYRRSPLAVLGAALVATTAYGVAIELMQRPVPGRFASLDDVMFDAIGAAVVLAAGALIFTRWPFRAARSPSPRA